MQPAQFSVKPLTNHLAVTHDHSSDKRIRTDPPTPALRELQRPPKMLSIRACQLRFHATD